MVVYPLEEGTRVEIEDPDGKKNIYEPVPTGYALQYETKQSRAVRFRQGSLITANKPVAVLVASGGDNYDCAAAMMPPTRQLGQVRE